MLHMLTAPDFLYRLRRPEELKTCEGGGVIFSQAVHQVDVAMQLLGSSPISVFAKTGNWGLDRPSEGRLPRYCRLKTEPSPASLIQVTGSMTVTFRWITPLNLALKNIR